MKILQPKAPVTATCPLGHPWEAEREVINYGLRRSEGRRPRPDIRTLVAPATCPVCHSRPAVLMPRKFLLTSY